MNHYTSIEQSKKLLELGLSPETADFEYKCIGYTMHTTRPTDDFKYKVMLKGQDIPHEPKYDIPCWSVGALLEVMPIVLPRVGRFRLDYTLHTTGHKRVVYSHKMMVLHKENGKNLIEAAFNMVVWLLENGYININ